MQTISYDYKLISPLMSYIHLLYSILSGGAEKRGLLQDVFPLEFEPVVDLFDRHGYGYDCKYAEFIFPKIPKQTNDKAVVVCVSGGKDSLATAMYYKERDYDVRLFHLKGINKCYPDEYKAIENAARYLGLSLCEWEVKLHGNHQYIEHPLKNWIFMNAALTYAIREVGTTNVAVGNFQTAYLSDQKFEVSAGDTIEFWHYYEDIIHMILPDFQVLLPLENVGETLRAFEGKPELLEISQSCIGTYRFKEYKGNLVRKKYNYPLLPHRCGSCWKCALEYIYYVEYDMFEMNEEYYKHCLKILYNTMKFENDYNEYTVEDVWNNYMLTDSIENSKLDGILDLNMKGLR